MSRRGDGEQIHQQADAEAAVLGSVLLEGWAYAEAASVLKAGAVEFLDPRNRAMWELIGTLHRQGAPMDGVVIRAEAEKAGIFEKLGGYEYFGHLVGSVPTAHRVREYAQIVHTAYRLNVSADVGDRLKRAALSRDADLESVLTEARKAIDGIDELSSANESIDAQAAVDGVLDYFYAADEAVTGIRTGLGDIDLATDGLRPEELVVIGARPAQGKTALLMTLARKMGRHEGAKVGIVSLEMGARSITQRMLAIEANIPASTFRRRDRSVMPEYELRKHAAALGRCGFTFATAPAMTLDQIRAFAHTTKRRRGLDVLIVDYIQIIEPDAVDRRKGVNREQVVAGFSRRLKQLARELKIVVVCAAQLNRLQGNDRQPVMSDLRESGAIEQDADMIFLLWRKRLGEENGREMFDNEAALVMDKFREGTPARFKLYFDARTTEFVQTGDRVPSYMG